MSISAIVSSSPLNQLPSLQKVSQQQSTAFQELTQALQSGNLSSAQQAVQALSGAPTNVSSLQSAQLTQELKALGTALQAGNQAAVGSTPSSTSTNTPVRAAHHHYHHGGGGLPGLTSGFPSGSVLGINAANASEALQTVNLTV